MSFHSSRPRVAAKVCLRPVILLALALTSALPAHAQVSLTALDVPYTQNFDSLPSTGSTNPWTSNSTVPGWYALRTGNGTFIIADAGSGNAGGLYSYGATSAADRALGSIGSSGAAAGNFFYGLRLLNNTATTITSLDVAYTGEQWRNSTAAAQTITFSYLIATPPLTGSLAEFTSAGVAVTSLDFTSPVTGGTVGALVGNLAANQSARSFTISGLSLAAGAEIMLRWSDPDHAGTDHGLAIDNVSVTPHGIPLSGLSINDVSISEGNSGTTNLDFTVSLTDPAPAGGVSFDIATSNVTAISPGDYAAVALTGQTISAGNTSYTFSVPINGDTTFENTETFNVNVGNVAGVPLVDGQGVGSIANDDSGATLSINDVTANEGNGAASNFTFTVSLTQPAPSGGVSFDVATADGSAVAPSDYTAQSPSSRTIPQGSSSATFIVPVVGDAITENDETFFVNISNASNALLGDSQGLGTIVNDDMARIHDLQGPGAASPIAPSVTVAVEGVVTANFQGSNRLSGFFVQEEDADIDADPLTSEGIFVFCSSCPTVVAEGQRVRVTGTVSEFFAMTQINATTAGQIAILSSGNHLVDITPATIGLPVIGPINDYYEPREGMLVRYTDSLSVSEYFELNQFGQIELFQGGRPRQYTEMNVPSTAGYAAHMAGLDARRVIIDDENNVQNSLLLLADGSQFAYYPRQNGGFGVGTQGADFFRGGDVVNNLTGVLHWSFAGTPSPDAWRVRPTRATPAVFTPANPRPATAPDVGGAIKAAAVNVLNYFSTIDTTASNSNGPCGPVGGLDCRGADSMAELVRQRERTAIVLCGLNADVAGLMEIENTASATINELLLAVNARCGAGRLYAFANTGGTLGDDAIRVQIIYRTGVVSPVGVPLVDTDAINNRPTTAQTFDVVDPTNPAFGERFTLVANHFKSKGCSGATGGDADADDGQGCFSATRTAQSNRLLTWLQTVVIPAAGDSDVLLVGDFNSYAKEPPIAALTAGGYNDLETSFLGANAYSYVFDAQLGHLDYALASPSLSAKVTGIAPWHINADEVPLFDYNDEILDTGESAFEKKPNGSMLSPPRTVYAAESRYRASDHDPVLVGLFADGDRIFRNGFDSTATP